MTVTGALQLDKTAVVVAEVEVGAADAEHAGKALVPGGELARLVSACAGGEGGSDGRVGDC